jgi:hypothetical protein
MDGPDLTPPESIPPVNGTGENATFDSQGVNSSTLME